LQNDNMISYILCYPTDYLVWSGGNSCTEFECFSQILHDFCMNSLRCYIYRFIQTTNGACQWTLLYGTSISFSDYTSVYNNFTYIVSSDWLIGVVWVGSCLDFKCSSMVLHDFTWVRYDFTYVGLSDLLIGVVLGGFLYGICKSITMLRATI
jgi:hypothetical protein